MEYIPGIIHESLQKERFYQIESDFTWINCTKRYSYLSSQVDYEEFTEPIELKKGDVIIIKFFKPTHDPYVYLVAVESCDNIKYYNTETIVSKGLIDINTEFFRDITLLIKREDKLNKILNDKSS